MLTQLDFALSQLLSFTHLSLVELQKLLRTPQRKFETPQNSLHSFLNENQFREFRRERKEKEE